MASADTQGDGLDSRSRHHSRTSTIPEGAPASDAPHRSPALEQPLPATELRAA